jgi:hypothetical protein
MGKKKKKDKANGVFLKDIDKSINKSYDGIIEEISMYQSMLKTYDRKALKKARKRSSIRKGITYDMLRREGRINILRDIEDSNILARIQNIFNDLVPVVILIARLVASLILSILSIPAVKVHISEGTLTLLTSIYQKAMEICPVM